MAHPLRGPIVTLQDARRYEPPDPDAPQRLGMLPELVERYKGRRAVCFHHRAAFMWSAYLMGLDDLLASFLDQPDLVEHQVAHGPGAARGPHQAVHVHEQAVCGAEKNKALQPQDRDLLWRGCFHLL